MNKILQLFGITVILFVLLQPNLYMKIPTAYHSYFIILHCLLFSLLYIFIRTTFIDITVENFTQEEINVFDKKQEGFLEMLQKYSPEELSKLTEKDYESKMKEITNDLTDDQKQKMEKYIKSKVNKIEKVEPPEPSIHEKMEDLLNKASVEQILFLGSLPKPQKNALKKKLETMNMKDIEKYSKLDVDQLKKTIIEITKSA